MSSYVLLIEAILHYLLYAVLLYTGIYSRDLEQTQVVRDFLHRPQNFAVLAWIWCWHTRLQSFECLLLICRHGSVSQGPWKATLRWLSTLQSSKLLTFKGRMFLKDYALTISLFVSIVAAHYLNQGLFPVTFIDTKTSGFNTTSDRPWNTDLTAISGRGVLCAALAAFPVVVFFYLDQNISSSLCQKPEMKLSKGSYFHSSFACMAFFNTLGPLFGLPFVTGSLPHSPQFVLSLAETDEEHRITKVRENRLAPLLCYFLIGLPLLAPSLLERVPKAAVFGTLIFVGIDGIQSTQLYERVLLIATDPRFFPKTGPFANLPASTMHLYTLIQLVLVVGCWMVNADFGLYFPLFFISLIPVRW